MTTQIRKIFFYYIVIALLLLKTTVAQTNPSHVMLKNIDQTMQRMCNQNQFSGTALIAIDNKIVFRKACGLANRGLNVKNDINTKFNLGSVGKLFTSIAIAQLIQHDKISYSTPVYKIIPDWLPQNREAKKMTVGQLLIHASGLGNFMDDQRWKVGADSGLYVRINDYKPLIRSNKILFSPGTSQSYSNNGYLILGAIIEKISHNNYSDYLENNIFKPSGMMNTGIWELDEIIPNRAEGYFKDCKHSKCRWKNNNFEAPFIGSPAGGAYSTIDDLFKFSRSIYQFKLLNKEFTHKILSTDILAVSRDISIKQYKIDNAIIPENFSPYGFAGAWNKFGFAVWENPLLIGHTGGIQGASAFFAMSPDKKYTVIILSNMGGSGAIKFYKKIRESLGMSERITNY